MTVKFFFFYECISLSLRQLTTLVYPSFKTMQVFIKGLIVNHEDCWSFKHLLMNFTGSFIYDVFTRMIAIVVLIFVNFLSYPFNKLER